MDWGEVFCRIAERFGWTFEEIGELTLQQLRAVARYLEKYPAPYTVPVQLKE